MSLNLKNLYYNKLFTNNNSFQNGIINGTHCVQSDPSIPKTTHVLQKFIQIPYEKLHGDMKTPAQNFYYQNLGRAGGAFLYPLLELFGCPGIIFYAPVCVGTHWMATRYAYQAARATLQSGDITTSSEVDCKVKKLIDDKMISGFHFNYRGDLVLHVGKPSTVSLMRFKGISLEEKEENYPLFCNINAIRDRLLPASKSQISYYQLEPDAQKQVNQILTARRLRFRACLATGCATGFLGNMFMPIKDFISFPLYFGGGSTTIGLISPMFKVAKHTNDLWSLIQKKDALIEIIQPKQRHLYQHIDFKNMYLTVSTFGNLSFSKEKPYSLRNSHRY